MQSRSTGTLLIILAVIFTFPFWIGGLIGGIFGMIGAIFGAIGGVIGAVFGMVGGIFGWIFGSPWHVHWNAFPIIVIVIVIALVSRSRRI